jgi:WD40 repeat protein
VTAHAIIAIASVIAAGAATGCGPRSTRVPDEPVDVPAVTWATELPAYRLPARPAAVLVDDTRLVVALSSGAIAAVDLATGAMTTRAAPGNGEVVALFRGAAGVAIVAFETKDTRLALFTVDDDLALRALREDPDPGWSRTTIAAAPDGRLAMAANERPLTLYDADGTPGKTMFVTSVRDLGWDDLAFADGGKYLLADRAGTLHSFEVATGIGIAGVDGEVIAASDGTTAIAVIDTALTLIDARTLQPLGELARPADRLAAISRDGALVARVDDTSVMIHDTASRRMIARYALGPSHGGIGYIAFTPRGDRIVVVSGSVVRVLDVASGALSDPGPGPYETPAFLRVTRQRVIAADDRIRSWPVGGGPPVLVGPDEAAGGDAALSPSAGWVVMSRALPTVGDAAKELELITWPLTGEHTPRARYRRKDSVSSIAIDDAGDIVVGAWRGADGDLPGHNVIDAGDAAGGWERLLEVHYDGYVDAIDAETRLAAISSGGAVRVVQLPGRASVASAAIPGCDSGGGVHLDGAGRRLATDNDKALWIWSFADRRAIKVGAAGLETGKVGSVAFVPGRTEVVIDLDERIAIWDYTGGPVLGTPVDGVIGRLAVDPAGTRVAAAQSNGRILVFALADLRKGTPEATTEATSEERCDRDPLAAPADRNTTRRTWEPGVAP